MTCKWHFVGADSRHIPYASLSRIKKDDVQTTLQNNLFWHLVCALKAQGHTLRLATWSSLKLFRTSFQGRIISHRLLDRVHLLMSIASQSLHHSLHLEKRKHLFCLTCKHFRLCLYGPLKKIWSPSCTLSLCLPTWRYQRIHQFLPCLTLYWSSTACHTDTGALQ